MARKDWTGLGGDGIGIRTLEEEEYPMRTVMGPIMVAPPKALTQCCESRISCYARRNAMHVRDE